jgi:hypothetical protein
LQGKLEQVFAGSACALSQRRTASWPVDARSRVDAQEAVKSPTDAQEPGARGSRGRGFGWSRQGFAPAVEPGRRGQRIGARARGPRPVLASVAEHVPQGIPHLQRRAQDAVVVAVGEDAAEPPPQAIQRSSHANRQALHPARHRGPAAPLGEQVHVIRLHAEVHQPEPRALATRHDRSAHRSELSQVTQRRQARLHPQRHRHGKPGRERRSGAMRNSGSFSARLGPSPLAPSAPSVRESELGLLRRLQSPSSSPHGSSFHLGRSTQVSSSTSTTPEPCNGCT